MNGPGGILLLLLPLLTILVTSPIGFVAGTSYAIKCDDSTTREDYERYMNESMARHMDAAKDRISGNPYGSLHFRMSLLLNDDENASEWSYGGSGHRQQRPYSRRNPYTPNSRNSPRTFSLVQRAAALDYDGTDFLVTDRMNKQRVKLNTTRFNDFRVGLKTIPFAVLCYELPPGISCDFFEEIMRLFFSYVTAWINAYDAQQENNARAPVKQYTIQQWSQSQITNYLRHNRYLPQNVIEIRFRDFSKPLINQHGQYFAPVERADSLLGLANYNSVAFSLTTPYHFQMLHRAATNNDPVYRFADQQMRHVLFNKYRHVITRVPNRCDYDLGDVIMHELLHVYGLDHIRNRRAIMNPTLTPYVFHDYSNPEMMGLPALRAELYALRYFWLRNNELTVGERLRTNYGNYYATLQNRQQQDIPRSTPKSSAEPAPSNNDDDVGNSRIAVNVNDRNVVNRTIVLSPNNANQTVRIETEVNNDNTNTPRIRLNDEEINTYTRDPRAPLVFKNKRPKAPQSSTDDRRNNENNENPTDAALRYNLAKIDPYNEETRQEIMQRIRETFLRNRGTLIQPMKIRLIKKLYDAILVGRDIETHEWIDSFVRDNPSMGRLNNKLISFVRT